MSDCSFEDFHRLVDQQFQLELPGGGSAPLVLTDCRATGPGGSTSSFALTFKAGPDAPIEQSSYLVSADGFGPEPIFLVPVGQRSGDTDFPLEYEAIFNRVPG